jgi:hypothetical protein
MRFHSWEHPGSGVRGYLPRLCWKRWSDCTSWKRRQASARLAAGVAERRGSVCGQSRERRERDLAGGSWPVEMPQWNQPGMCAWLVRG